MALLTDLETPIAGLYAQPPAPLPFAPALGIRTFLLRRDRGNLLIYGVPGVDSGAPAIEELGGIARRYLSHRHEAAFASGRVTAPLFVHANEREAVERSHRVRGTFSRRHRLDDDFEVIPTPGHTSGATAYLWDTGSHRLLFTGDTIYLDGGEWVAAVLGSSDRAAYMESLETIRGLEFDVLVPWAAGGDEPWYAATDRRDTGHRIDAILERLRRGEAR